VYVFLYIYGSVYMYRESSFIIRKQSGFLELGLIYVSVIF